MKFFYHQIFLNMNTPKYPLPSTMALNWSVANLKIRYRLTGNPIPIRDSEDSARVLYQMWDKSLINVQEQSAALYLNSKNQAIGFRQISTGTMSSVSIDKGLILACALLVRADAIILAHNHPSGEPIPSKSDIRNTVQLQKSIHLIGCRLIDHIILSEHQWYSMADGRNFLPDL